MALVRRRNCQPRSYKVKPRQPNENKSWLIVDINSSYANQAHRRKELQKALECRRQLIGKANNEQDHPKDKLLSQDKTCRAKGVCRSCKKAFQGGRLGNNFKETAQGCLQLDKRSLCWATITLLGSVERHHTDALPSYLSQLIEGQEHKVKKGMQETYLIRKPMEDPKAKEDWESDVTCFGCGKKGHYKNKCPNNGSQGRGNQI
ncbi:reverse transcriptase domain-containing protein [Tanacetum coccineum]